MGGTGVRALLVCVILVGCGKVGANQPDGGIPDDAGATVDASPRGSATMVTEAALFGGTVGAKVGSIDIVSNMPDSSMLAAAKTGADGGATVDVFAGGSVTAIYHHTADLGADLITWVGVKPGDVLTFGSRKFSAVGQQNASLGTQTYSWPALAGASHYRVYTTCNDGISVDPPSTSIAAVPEFSLCHQSSMTVLYTAVDGNNALIGYGVRTGLTFQNAATVALPAWNAPSAAMINITGLPAEAATVSGNFRVVVDPLFDFNPSLGYSGSVTGGAFSVPSLPFAQGVGLRALAAVDLARGGQYRPMHLLDALSLSASSQTLTAPALPPWSQSRTTASAGSRMASWLLVSTAASVHKGQLLHMSWTHSVAGAVSQSQWDVILPPGQTSFAFPTLPAALADNEPAANDVLTASTRVFDIPSVKDYDALRALRSANLMCLECAVRTADVARVVFTDTL